VQWSATLLVPAAPRPFAIVVSRTLKVIPRLATMADGRGVPQAVNLRRREQMLDLTCGDLMLPYLASLSSWDLLAHRPS